MVNSLSKRAKRCSTCKQTKLAEQFYRNKSRTNGLSWECKKCAQRRAADLAKRYPERKNAWERACRAKLKAEVLTHYGNGKLVCVKCGFEDIRALTVDHIEGGGSKHRGRLGRRGTAFLRWLRMQDYPEGFQTLYMNCQFLKMRESQEYGGFFYGNN